MIPSLNRQDAKSEDWPDGYLSGSHVDLEKFEALAYTCDCCKTHIAHKVSSSPMGGGSWLAWPASFNPRLVKVGNVTYFGCSVRCGQILFEIHHRYALLLLEGRKA